MREATKKREFALSDGLNLCIVNVGSPLAASLSQKSVPLHDQLNLICPRLKFYSVSSAFFD